MGTRANRRVAGTENKAEKSHAKTQSRLRPISPFSYVGQGRKGKTEKTRIAAKDRKERKETAERLNRRWTQIWPWAPITGLIHKNSFTTNDVSRPFGTDRG
jgi:hypothetical protein